jgi:DNA-binding GntR family transcriptional regulator
METRAKPRHIGASLVETVYATLLERILTGQAASGAVLSELALSRDLGVSRTPVHDALRQLAKDGLVVTQRNRRATVVGFSPDDVFEIFEMRKFLEGPAANLAAGRMDTRNLTPLREAASALAASPRAADWVERWAAFDEQFHSAVAESSGNRRLARDIARYRLLHRGLNTIETDPATLRAALDEHVAILDALEDRDGPRAGRLMVEHIAAWQQHFIRHWSQRGPVTRQGDSG